MTSTRPLSPSDDGHDWTSIAWAEGPPTRHENDRPFDGTRPVDFERDRSTVIDLIYRFAAPDVRYARHPAFGALTRDEWLVWGSRHTDHHLRQFAV